MKKVLFESGSSRIGGAENFICRLAEGLRPLFPDVRFDVLVLFEKGGLHERMTQAFSQVYYIRDTGYSLRQFIEWHGCSVFHAIDSHCRVADAAHPIAHKVKFVQNVFPEIGISKYSPSREWLENGWRICAAIITENERNIEHLHRPGRQPHFLGVIENGIETEFWKPGPPWSDEKAYDIIWVGRAEQAKGADLMLELAEKLPHLAWCVVLNEEKEPYASALRKMRHVNTGASCSPEGLRTRYRHSSIYLHTSLSEGMPSTLLEAMACGCIPVASAVGGIPQVVKDQVGHLVSMDQGDFVASCTGILERLSTLRPSERIKASQRASKHVQDRFSMATTIEKYAELYRSLL